MSQVLPDARPTNWVDRFAPGGLQPWLKLGRFDRPTGIWLLMLPGWQGIALASALRWEGPSPRLLLLFFLGAALMRAAGCAFNDLVDKDFDAQVARTANRPVASGRISVAGAWAFLIACSLGGLAILLQLNGLSLALGAASLLLVAAYPFMKRITWWPQAWLGLTFNWGALLGYAAVAGGSKLAVLDLDRPFLPALLLYAGGLFWTLGYDTIYAIQDLEDDALAGVKSSARRLGAAAPAAVRIFYAIAVILAGAAGLTAHLKSLFWWALAAYAAHLFWQTRGLRTDDSPGALRRFKANTGSGLILLAAIGFGS